MQDFEKHKKNFFSFLNTIELDEKIGIIAHANCLDGMTSAVLAVEILRKKHPSVKTSIHFISYLEKSLIGLESTFNHEKIKKVLIVDLNVDASLLDEFKEMKKKFDVLLVDHHPANSEFNNDEMVIKTSGPDCTSLVIYKFGENIIDYNRWSELMCAASISEFAWKSDDNLKFIQKYYPLYYPEDEGSEIMQLMFKLNSLVIYYAKDSLKAYEILLNRDFKIIDKIYQEVNFEMEKCLDDFEKNAERHFNNHLYFYFFKSKFSMGSKMGTILSMKHKGSTIVTLSEVEGTDMIKASGRNNGTPLKYFINDMCDAGIKGLENSMAGGHKPASGATFLKKDLNKFKQNVLEFVSSKINK